MPDDTAKDLESQAKQHIDDMPAETALGNADPEGGGEGTPAEFVAQTPVKVPTFIAPPMRLKALVASARRYP